jgi:hypothetical protein
MTVLSTRQPASTAQSPAVEPRAAPARSTLTSASVPSGLARSPFSLSKPSNGLRLNIPPAAIAFSRLSLPLPVLPVSLPCSLQLRTTQAARVPSPMSRTCRLPRTGSRPTLPFGPSSPTPRRSTFEPGACGSSLATSTRSVRLSRRRSEVFSRGLQADCLHLPSRAGEQSHLFAQVIFPDDIYSIGSRLERDPVSTLVLNDDLDGTRASAYPAPPIACRADGHLPTLTQTSGSRTTAPGLGQHSRVAGRDLADAGLVGARLWSRCRRRRGQLCLSVRPAAVPSPRQTSSCPLYL